MTDDPTSVVFTIKELLQRLDERLSAVDQKLDLRLAQQDERITHVERTQSERAYMIEEHKQMRVDIERLLSYPHKRTTENVESLMVFRARFLPLSIVVALIALIALLVDIYVRAFT